MAARRNRNRTTRLIPQRLRRVCAPLLAVVVVVGGLYLYDYITVNMWIERDAGRLEDYSVLLIENKQEVARDDSDPLGQLDRLLIEEMRRGRRNVVNASRSEIKYSLLRTRAYVKISLETALPEKPDRRARLKIVCELKRSSQGWQLAGPPLEKTIE